MAKGDYDAQALAGMAVRAKDERRPEIEKAKDVLRIASQLTANDLALCTAFRLDPFAYLAAKLSYSDAIAAERQERIRAEDFHEREARARRSFRA